jgi:hypothetical protein
MSAAKKPLMKDRASAYLKLMDKRADIDSDSKPRLGCDAKIVVAFEIVVARPV